MVKVLGIREVSGERYAVCFCEGIGNVKSGSLAATALSIVQRLAVAIVTVVHHTNVV
jgi:hypothetical protein